jgi:signal transduction histidine kinase
MNFKIKVLIQIAAIFAASILIISYTNYRMLETTVKSKTDENLVLFTDGILAQINHLDVIFDATKRTLARKHIAIAKSIAYMLDNASGDLTPEDLRRLAEPLDIIELSVADKNGVMINSSIPKYIGFDYKAYEVTAKYMALAEGTQSKLSEEPRESVFDDAPGEINHYVGLARPDGFIQIGFNADVIGRLQDEINIERTIKETRIGNIGYGMVLSAGVIAAHPDEGLLGRDVSGEDWYRDVSAGDGFVWTRINGEPCYAGYRNAGGAIVVGIVPEGDYYRELHELRTATLLLLVLVIAFMSAVIFFLLGRLLRPINHLAKGLKEIARGNLDTRIEGSYGNEFDTIKDAINAMLADIKVYIDDKFQAERQAHEMEKELTESRMSVMLSQIRPHFLFNSLLAIQDLCRTDPDVASIAVAEFSKYLRGNLDSLSMAAPIPFTRELEHVKNYLALEKKRFDERLRIVYDIKADGFLLPALTLQPITENAVRHGVTKKLDGGTVTVTAVETETNYVVTVADDGVGFDVNGKLDGDGRAHVGIENVRARLAAMSGGALTIKSEPGVGTTAVIKIPKRKGALS